MKINKRPLKNIDIIMLGVADIIDGLISISSLGYYHPDVGMKYLCWRTKLYIKRTSK